MNLLQQIYEAGFNNKTNIAVSEGKDEYSYTDLFQAISQVMEQINDAQPSDRPILVFGKNDFLTLATMLAVSSTGHSYIPVDAHTPLERTEMIFQSANPSLVLTTIELSSEFFESLSHPKRIKYLKNKVFNWEEVDLSHAVSGNDSNYIIYTSGTTGTPKGVDISHDNLESFTRWMNEDFPKFEHNNFLEQALYSFDLSIFSIYPSLTTAGTLISLSRDETTNFKLLFDRINRSEINIWISTPSFVDICLLDPSFVQSNHPGLKEFIFCGEELTLKTSEKLLNAFPDAFIYNTYGPTEATGAISKIQITKDLLNQYNRVPLGYAKPGVKVKIIDDELIIIGDSVAKGYFENEEKTAQSFFEIDHENAYRSGDAGTLDQDGLLHYSGRIDFQVKFNGFRIELQDIEANLLRIDGIEKTIIIPKIDENHKVTSLIAAIKTQKELLTKGDERVYTKFLKGKLLNTIMDYMIPTKFVYLNEFPLNDNGKVDRKRLAQQVLEN